MRTLLVATLVLTACTNDPGGAAEGSDPHATTGGADDDGNDDAAPPEGDASESSAGDDAPPADDDTTGGGPPPELVAVGHERELRGVWVASVANINFPSSQGMAVAAMQEELAGFVDVAVENNLNAIFFQVRPEMDALYASDLEPWSRYLTGSQGVDPGFDPLDHLLAEAHARGIEVHAWFNPYRAAANANVPVVPPHVALQYPEYAYEYGAYLWMDPGADPVMQHDVDVILDVVDRYDVDGIHFDDYFYPYPDGSPFPDSATYGAYMGGGGMLGLGDWRRDNVNRLVELLHDEIEAAKPWVRFGISPFGIYMPGMPPGITGLDQYAAIYADPVKWIQEGWVDYIAPQLYWPTTQTAQAYEPLVEWWVSIAPEGRNVFVGNFLSQLGSSSAWTVDEFRAQVELSREYQIDSPGNIFFHIAPLESDQAGVATMLRDELYTQPVLPPPMWERAADEVAYPDVVVEGTSVTMMPGDDMPIRAWVVYRDDGTDFVLHEIAYREAGDTLELPPGRWAITAAARSDVESLGVVVQLPG